MTGDARGAAARHVGAPAHRADGGPGATPSCRGRRHIDLGAVLLLVGGMACFGSATPVSRVIGRGFPVWLASGLRMAVAAAVLVPVLALRREGGLGEVVSEARRARAGDRWLLAGIALVGTFLFSVFMLLGMRHAPGAVGAVVMAGTPAVTALGAVTFLGDRLDVWRAAAVVAAVAGIVLVNAFADVASGSGRNLLLGTALVFAAVCCEAAYSLMGKRLTASFDAMAIAGAAAVLALAAFLPFALWDLVRFDWGRPTGGQWLALLWWGAGTMALGSWLWFRGMSRVAGSTAAAFMGVMPVSALLLSYLLLGESFQWAHVAGVALVLAGLAAAVRSGAPVH